MIKLNIKEIKDLFANVDNVNDKLFIKYQKDTRKGVQQVIKSTQKRLRKEAEKHVAFEHRFDYENKIWHKGVNFIAGVDEVGRGPLAGPVVAAAVILPKDFDLINVFDSKQLSDQKRRELVPLIKKECIAYNCAVVSNEVIDKVNIYEATKIAMKNAINGLKIKPEHIIVDAMPIDVNISQTKLIKGDAKSNSVAAASIIAKVYRDNLMIKYNEKYPEYGFLNNDGYGTKQHLNALKKYGVTPIHRKSFSPVRNLL